MSEFVCGLCSGSSRRPNLIHLKCLCLKVSLRTLTPRLSCRQKVSVLKLIEWERAREGVRDQERKIAPEPTWDKKRQHLDSCTRSTMYPCLSKEDISVCGPQASKQAISMSSPSPCCHWLKRPGCLRAWSTACTGVEGSASQGLIGVRQSGSLTHRKLLGAVCLIGKQRGMTIRSWYHHIQWQRSHSRAAVVISYEHLMLTVYATIDGHMALGTSPVVYIQSGSKNITRAKCK